MKKGKLVELEAKQLIKPKISIEEFKKILNKNGDNFSDDEIKEIRDFLYNIAEIDFLLYQQYIKEKAEELKLTNDNIEEAKIISLEKKDQEIKTNYLKSA
jgi:F0F1-type ATP synthase delta subunit